MTTNGGVGDMGKQCVAIILPHLQTLQSHEGVALSHAFGGVCQMEITENGMKTALLPNK